MRYIASICEQQTEGESMGLKKSSKKRVGVGKARVREMSVEESQVFSVCDETMMGLYDESWGKRSDFELLQEENWFLFALRK